MEKTEAAGERPGVSYDAVKEDSDGEDSNSTPTSAMNQCLDYGDVLLFLGLRHWPAAPFGFKSGSRTFIRELTLKTLPPVASEVPSPSLKTFFAQNLVPAWDGRGFSGTMLRPCWPVLGLCWGCVGHILRSSSAIWNLC